MSCSSARRAGEPGSAHPRASTLCPRSGLAFELDKSKGNGSHYWVKVGAESTYVQHKLNPGRIERLLKQLKVDPRDLP